MDDSRVRVTVGDDGVAEVAMVRTDKMNALDSAMFQALLDAIETIRGDRRVRAVLLHGEGRAFCAGLDKARFDEMGSGKTSGTLGDLIQRRHGAANGPQNVAWGWRQLPVPVVASVHGVAYGGGLQIALGADIRIVHPAARLSVLEIKWGLVPDMAGCVFLTELVRPDVARELTFTGREVSGVEAQTIGLATRVSETPLDDARVLVARIAAASPAAVRAGKRLLNAALPVDSGKVLLAESYEQARLIGSAEQAEAVRAALEGRKGDYRPS